MHSLFFFVIQHDPWWTSNGWVPVFQFFHGKMKNTPWPSVRLKSCDFVIVFLKHCFSSMGPYHQLYFKCTDGLKPVWKTHTESYPERRWNLIPLQRRHPKMGCWNHFCIVLYIFGRSLWTNFLNTKNCAVPKQTDPNKKRSLATPRGAMAIGSMEVLTPRGGVISWVRPYLWQLFYGSTPGPWAQKPGMNIGWNNSYWKGC